MGTSKTSTTETSRIYPKLAGAPYKQFLGRMHGVIQPDWYLEIGSSRGDSLTLATAKTIAVDPVFNLKFDALAKKPELHLFQMTSDDFFASERACSIAPHIDMAFLDGMHLFEFLLRDFIGTEKLCTKESVIAMHDCIPITPIAAERIWKKSETRDWTGDVWKLVPILRKYRPDLDVKVVDCPPSGLTIISNLNPKNTTLSENYDLIVKEFIGQSIASYGKDLLLEDLHILSSDSDEVAPYNTISKI